MIKATLLATMGDDLSVVNAARVSFDKESASLSEADVRLIKYLAEHNHWSPFSHCFASFRVKAPIFVARQLQKHTVGLAWNETSRRYVDSKPEFYVPTEWRKKADNVKQGSSEEAVTDGFFYSGSLDMHIQANPSEAVGEANSTLLALYQSLLAEGVCPEQARMVLPQSMLTEWIWSGSLFAFARVCKLRLDPHTQKETRDVAALIAESLSLKFPVSWAALVGGVS